MGCHATHDLCTYVPAQHMNKYRCWIKKCFTYEESSAKSSPKPCQMILVEREKRLLLLNHTFFVHNHTIKTYNGSGTRFGIKPVQRHSGGILFYPNKGLRYNPRDSKRVTQTRNFWLGDKEIVVFWSFSRSLVCMKRELVSLLEMN